MTSEQIEQRIAELEAAKPQIQANFERQMNYQLGLVDGQIALLQELLETEVPGESH
jgi:hypothetical protein